jgi:hypothetical protein
MKVIFLDFDGVLNSSASFIMESRKKKKLMETDPEAGREFRVNNTLCHVCTSNFQYILDKCEDDVKIVISSTWRNLYDLEWLKSHLASYGIDSSRVIDKTPSSFNRERGFEINEWLEDHPEVTEFVILDDNFIGNGYEQAGKVVATSWATGLTLDACLKAIDILGGQGSGADLPL